PCPCAHTGTTTTITPQPLAVPTTTSVATGSAMTLVAMTAPNLLPRVLIGTVGPADQGPALGSAAGTIQGSPSSPAGQMVVASRAVTRTGQAADAHDPAAVPQLSTPDDLPHGSRGPQGGAQSSSGGGGAASPLMILVEVVLATGACLRFVPR